MNEFKKVCFGHLGKAAVILLSGALLTACQTRAEKEGEFSRQSSYRTVDRYPIKVEKGEVRLKVPTGAGGHFSSDREHEVRKFINDYQSAGSGYMVVSVPASGGGKANAAAGKIAKIASQAGISASSVRYQEHSGSRHAPVVISYRRHFAVTKKCGNWPKSLAINYVNNPYENFGCAHQHNLAAMAANPRDLVTPRSTSSPDAARMLFASALKALMSRVRPTSEDD